MLDSVFLARVAAMLPAHPPALRGVAIGHAFLHASLSPRQAFQNALAFRREPEGRDVRERMKQLLTLASSHALPKASALLEDLDRELRDVLLHRFGVAPAVPTRSESDTTVLFSLMGSFKIVLSAAMHLLPANIRTEVTSLLHTPLSKPTGFQLIFQKYLAEPPAFREKSSA
jgi:hypothetical protein